MGCVVEGNGWGTALVFLGFLAFLSASAVSSSLGRARLLPAEGPGLSLTFISLQSCFLNPPFLKHARS